MHTRTFARHQHAQRTRQRLAAHGNTEVQRLAVDADRDPLLVGVDDHLPRRDPGQTGGTVSAQESGGLGRARHVDPDDPQLAAVQAGPAAETGDVARAVGVVAHQ